MNYKEMKINEILGLVEDLALRKDRINQKEYTKKMLELRDEAMKLVR